MGCAAVVYCTLWCGCVFEEGEKAEETLLVPSNDASWWHGVAVLCCAVLCSGLMWCQERLANSPIPNLDFYQSIKNTVPPGHTFKV